MIKILFGEYFRAGFYTINWLKEKEKQFLLRGWMRGLPADC